MRVARPPASPGSLVAVSPASRDCGTPSMSRGKTSTSIRCGSLNASVYGRSVSYKVKSPGVRVASRPSWISTELPRSCRPIL